MVNPYQPAQRSPAPPQRFERKPGGGFAGGLKFAALYVLAIWTVHIVNLMFFAGGLNYYGIHPLDTSGLWGILFAPLLHANFEHLVSNTVPGAVFAFLVGFSGRRVFWEVTGIVVLVAGVGTWFIGGVGTNHIGASGLVYGWWIYLMLRGLFNRSLVQLIVGFLVGAAYSGLIWGVLPSMPGVSWQAHLCGAIGGLLAGLIITSDDPPGRQKRSEPIDRYL